MGGPVRACEPSLLGTNSVRPRLSARSIRCAFPHSRALRASFPPGRSQTAVLNPPSRPASAAGSLVIMVVAPAQTKGGTHGGQRALRRLCPEPRADDDDDGGGTRSAVNPQPGDRRVALATHTNGEGGGGWLGAPRNGPPCAAFGSCAVPTLWRATGATPHVLGLSVAQCARPSIHREATDPGQPDGVPFRGREVRSRTALVARGGWLSAAYC